MNYLLKLEMKKIEVFYFKKFDKSNLKLTYDNLRTSFTCPKRCY